MLDAYTEQIINAYYENNAKKLHTVINKIFVKHYGGIAGKDIEEFYGVGSDVIMDIIWNGRYDSDKGDFDGYIYIGLYCLQLKMNIRGVIVINAYLKLKDLMIKEIRLRFLYQMFL